jgi:hypothetical protein
MTTASSSPSYKGYRFPAEIISHIVCLYYRFSLSYRDVEELMATRGIVLTYETIRQWCHKFGQHAARVLRRRRPQTGDKWHLDEVFLKINGKLHELWRDSAVLAVRGADGRIFLSLRDPVQYWTGAFRAAPAHPQQLTADARTLSRHHPGPAAERGFSPPR